MREVIIILSFAMSAHLSYAQYVVNETALLNASVYNFEEINTGGLEFSPLPFNVGLLYISPEKKRAKYDRHINEGYFKIRYISDHKTLKLESLNNQKQHLGPMSYDNHRQVLYYTISQKGKKGRQKPRNIIATASYSNNVLVPQNGNVFDDVDYSIQHPALNNDGTEMIFSANRDDAMGGYDLYQSTLSDTGWTDPVPIIGDVNSAANEAFPVLWRDSLLLYASNVPGGHGGLDIYAATWSNGSWSAGTNLGPSVNSAGDDFGLILTHMRFGYLSSNRDGGAGKDDIYEVSFEEDLFLPEVVRDDQIEPIQQEQYTLHLSAFDPDGQVVSDALMRLTSTDSITREGDGLITTQSDENGSTSLTISPDLKYSLDVEHKGYEPLNRIINGSDGIETMELVLTPKSLPKEDVLTAQEELKDKSEDAPSTPDKIYVFDHLSYDYRSSNITKESTEQLNRLIQFLKDYPNATVDLLGHTDSRGMSDFNMKLSLERAESVKKIITEKGVSAIRIKTYGKGETALRNHCTNGVYCTDEEHQYNRRTEIRVQYK